MADEVKEGASEKEATNVSKTPLSGFDETRSSVLKQIEQSNSENPPEGKDAETDTGDKKESEKPAASTESEEGERTPPNEDDGTKKSGDVTKALHEERDRRRRLVKENRALQEKLDAEVKSLKEEIASLKTKAATSEDSSLEDDEDPKLKAVLQELAAVKAQLKTQNETRTSEDKKSAEQKQVEWIQKTDQELDEQGYPGFEVAAWKTHAALLKRYNDGDLTRAELADVEIQKKVFKEDVFPSIAKKFNLKEREKLLEEKKDAKRKAKLASAPGSAPKKAESEEVERSADKFFSEAFEQRYKSTIT